MSETQIEMKLNNSIFGNIYGKGVLGILVCHELVGWFHKLRNRKIKQ